MKRVIDHIRDHLLKGIITTPTGDKTESLESLQMTERNEEFQHLCENRKIIGRFRYGRFDRKTNIDYDRITSILRRLKMYQETGNLEHLIDIANLCELEFTHSTHPKKHFNAVDDGPHVQKVGEYNE